MDGPGNRPFQAIRKMCIRDSYTTLGGLLAVTYTDWIQFSLLILAVTIVGLPVAWKAAGGLAVIKATIPAGHWDLGAWGWAKICLLYTSRCV